MGEQTIAAEAPTRARDRLLGLSGLGFFAALLPVVVIPHASLDYPVDKPPAGEVITEFFQRHYALEEWQSLMHSLAGLALLVFGVAVARQVRRHQDDARVAATLIVAGAGLAAAVMVVTMAIVAGTISQTGGVDGVTEGWLYNLAWDVHFKMLYAVPLVLLPAGRVLGRTGALPRVLTGAGSVLAVLAVAAMVGGLTQDTEFLQFPVFFLLMLWVLATAVVALTRGVGPRPS
jgi:hypothetical protein